MRELSDIVAAFDALRVKGKPAALATVVAVEGSAYRRPGARMLIAEDGRTWGGVSGGCLERDVVRLARGVIDSGKPHTCRYDTTDDEELAGGVATGCRGTVEIFIEAISRDSRGPLPMLARVLRERMPLSIATVLRASNGLGVRETSRLALDAEGAVHGTIEHSELRSLILESLRNAWDVSRSRVLQYKLEGGTTEVFVERLRPPQALVIFGAGPDAAPVVNIAKTLGWHVTVVGSRPATGIHERFKDADVLHVTSFDAPTEGVVFPADAAVVMMTHNYPRDLAILSSLPKELRYLGLLGPRIRTDGLLAELPADKRPRDLFAPVGLDLGAETSHEIALAIIAEIQAAITRSEAVSLRDKDGPIHAPAEPASETLAPHPAGPLKPACPL